MPMIENFKCLCIEEIKRTNFSNLDQFGNDELKELYIHFIQIQEIGMMDFEDLQE